MIREHHCSHLFLLNVKIPRRPSSSFIIHFLLLFCCKTYLLVGGLRVEKSIVFFFFNLAVFFRVAIVFIFLFILLLLLLFRDVTAVCALFLFSLGMRVGFPAPLCRITCVVGSFSLNIAACAGCFCRKCYSHPFSFSFTSSLFNLFGAAVVCFTVFFSFNRHGKAAHYSSDDVACFFFFLMGGKNK